MARVEIISGPERRRHWTDEQKRAIVAESLAPGAVVSALARRAEVCPGQIYRWRHELHSIADGFARVLIAPPEDVAPNLADRAVDPEPAIEIAFAGQVQLRIPRTVPPELAAAVVKALSR
jgi:transposase